MRTVLGIDNDLAVQLEAEMRKSGKSFEETVDHCLRRGLAAPPEAPSPAPFKVNAGDLGGLQSGLSLDCIAKLLDEVEGPNHR